MTGLEPLLELYVLLIGTGAAGNRDLDRQLTLWLVKNTHWRNSETYAGDAAIPNFTTSVDAANLFLTTALPGYQIQALHGSGETAWSCDIGRAEDAADTTGGTGKTGPLAILSAAIGGLIGRLPRP